MPFASNRKIVKPAVEPGVIENGLVLRVAGEGSTAHVSPARLRQLQLEAAFDDAAPFVQLMPPAVRLAVLLGGASLTWAVVIGAVWVVVNL